jgi:hypothetical protein
LLQIAPVIRLARLSAKETIGFRRVRPPNRLHCWLYIDGKVIDEIRIEMKRVILESPFAGDVEKNTRYARACVRDSLLRGEAPIASHLLYTQSGILNDEIPAERQHGIDAGLTWKSVADGSVVYVDLGISRGMQYGIDAAKTTGLPVELRNLPADVMKSLFG